jgi:uncharacterized membrane protein YbhN (UPF0104 family)
LFLSFACAFATTTTGFRFGGDAARRTPLVFFFFWAAPVASIGKAYVERARCW